MSDINSRCGVRQCSNNSSNYNGGFFKFPKDKERAVYWARLCGRDDLLTGNRNLSSTTICGAHFEDYMFSKPTKTPKRRRLVSMAFPTLFAKEEDKEDNAQSPVNIPGPSTLMNYHDDSTTVAFAEAVLALEDFMEQECSKQNKIPKDQEVTSEDDVFILELLEAFLSADIALEKLNNPVLQKFLTKYCQRTITGDILQPRYIKSAKENYLMNIKNDLNNEKKLWVSIADAVSQDGYKVVNIMAGCLDSQLPGKCHLIDSKLVSETTAIDIAQIVDKSLNHICSDQITKHQRVSLLITSGSANMEKAGTILRNTYPNMIHLKCLEQTIQDICAYFLENFVNVTTLVLETNRLLLTYENQLMHTQTLKKLPHFEYHKPSSWMESACFYSEYFGTMKKLVHELSDFIPNIRHLKEIWSCDNTQMELDLIRHSCTGLIVTLNKLDQRVGLAQTVKLFEESINFIEASCPLSDNLKNYLADVKKDIGYQTMNAIGKTLELTNSASLSYFTYSPLTICEVKASLEPFHFGRHKFKSLKIDNTLSKLTALRPNLDVSMYG